ncbi:uncharacterized protein LOC113320770 [Papaver somniferum]|uniref:uncharacterized protein LOC113320770 n=1 Tax=Papaver somniferum TaxID=3469 RepID=UPI000E6F9B56|nr:uncharacterized protein LOC113320770 [Papaver somniferum]
MQTSGSDFDRLRRTNWERYELNTKKDIGEAEYVTWYKSIAKPVIGTQNMHIYGFDFPGLSSMSHDANIVPSQPPPKEPCFKTYPTAGASSSSFSSNMHEIRWEMPSITSQGDPTTIPIVSQAMERDYPCYNVTASNEELWSQLNDLYWVNRQMEAIHLNVCWKWHEDTMFVLGPTVNDDGCSPYTDSTRSNRSLHDSDNTVVGETQVRHSTSPQTVLVSQPQVSRLDPNRISSSFSPYNPNDCYNVTPQQQQTSYMLEGPSAFQSPNVVQPALSPGNLFNMLESGDIPGLSAGLGEFLTPEDNNGRANDERR